LRVNSVSAAKTTDKCANEAGNHPDDSVDACDAGVNTVDECGDTATGEIVAQSH
jgi:hypothetical protein